MGFGEPEAQGPAPAAPTPTSTVQHGASPVVATESSTAGTTTATIEPDDLTRIKGVAGVLEARLHELGITTFKEITTWTDEDMDRIDDHLGFEGRIQRDDWQGQARRFHNEKYPDDQI